MEHSHKATLLNEVPDNINGYQESVSASDEPIDWLFNPKRLTLNTYISAILNGISSLSLCVCVCVCVLVHE